MISDAAIASLGQEKSGTVPCQDETDQAQLGTDQAQTGTVQCQLAPSH